jgi:hypothetical protein
MSIMTGEADVVLEAHSDTATTVSVFVQYRPEKIFLAPDEKLSAPAKMCHAVEAPVETYLLDRIATALR